MRSSIGCPSRVRPVEIEGVVHRPRRMAFGNVERGEIVPVVLDLRPGRDREAEIGEDLGELVHHLADRMDAALGAPARPAASCRAARSPAAAPARPPRAPPCAPRSPRSPPRAGRGCAALRSAAPRATSPPSVLSSAGHRALLAERRDALRLQRRQIRRRGDPAEPVFGRFHKVAAHVAALAGRSEGV